MKAPWEALKSSSQGHTAHTGWVEINACRSVEKAYISFRIRNRANESVSSITRLFLNRHTEKKNSFILPLQTFRHFYTNKHMNEMFYVSFH